MKEETAAGPIEIEAAPPPAIKKKPSEFKKQWKKHKSLVPFVLPAIIFAILFSYLPMFGILIAFKDNINFIRYSNPLEAFMNAKWTFGHFEKIFSDPEILKYIGNTLIISILKIVILFPMPVVLAIMITEVNNKTFSKATQMAVFLPHFLSWVVVVGIFKSVFALDGPINQALINLRLMSAENPVYWFGEDKLFRGMVVFINGW
ncbi:MAG: sugar ABC transporter permease, partial [Clostridia bacterium]|nr:sugar ABC transporter permease [Clostridia bacterium]